VFLKDYMKITLQGGIYKRIGVNCFVFMSGSAQSFSDYILVQPYTIHIETQEQSFVEEEVSLLIERMKRLRSATESEIADITRAIDKLWESDAKFAG
jgi:hypothetical protein